MSILPAASRLGGGEAIRISLLRATAYSSALISPIALLTSILSYEALQIVYGSVYAGFWWILTVLSASHILLAILGSHATASYTLVQGDSKSYMYASMMGIASQVVIITMLVPTLGVIGILAAQVISSISGSLYLLIKISRELGIEIREILSKSSMPALASLAASIPLLIASISARHSPMALGLAGLAYAVLYIAALPILGLGRAELEGLQKILEGSGLLSRLAAPILRYMIYIRALADRLGIAV
jgi:O-antigen/teichoic acid export membrane protein